MAHQPGKHIRYIDELLYPPVVMELGNNGFTNRGYYNHGIFDIRHGLHLMAVQFI